MLEAKLKTIYDTEKVDFKIVKTNTDGHQVVTVSGDPTKFTLFPLGDVSPLKASKDHPPQLKTTLLKREQDLVVGDAEGNEITAPVWLCGNIVKGKATYFYMVFSPIIANTDKTTELMSLEGGSVPMQEFIKQMNPNEQVTIQILTTKQREDFVKQSPIQPDPNRSPKQNLSALLRYTIANQDSKVADTLVTTTPLIAEGDVIDIGSLESYSYSP